LPVVQVGPVPSARRARDVGGSERGLVASRVWRLQFVLPEVGWPVPCVWRRPSAFKTTPANRTMGVALYSRFSHTARDAVACWKFLRIRVLRFAPSCACKGRAAKSIGVVLFGPIPGKDCNLAHALGLDALASLREMTQGSFGGSQGYGTSTAHALANTQNLWPAVWARETMRWPLADYKAAARQAAQCWR